MSRDRYEFTMKQQREIRDRSNGVCEADKFGTYKFYGMGDADICHRKAVEIDHIVADGLKRAKPQSIEEGLHVCQDHHRAKTHGHDRPKINKAKRLRERGEGIKRRKGRPMPGSKASGLRKRMDGTVERRT